MYSIVSIPVAAFKHLSEWLPEEDKSLMNDKLSWLPLHRYPGADQPQEIVPEVLLRFWGRDISGEHARMRFDPGG